MTESTVLAMAGGTAGVVLAYLTLDVFVTFIPLSLPDNVTPGVNLQVLAFALALSMVTSFAFGLAPALKLSRGGAARPSDAALAAPNLNQGILRRSPRRSTAARLAHPSR
jgi:hypothetical protein